MSATQAQERPAAAGAFVRFLVTGGLSYLVDVGTLVALHSGAGWPLAAATTGAYVVAFGVTFTLNRTWVFRARQGSQSGQAVRYLVLVGINYLATLAIVLGLSHLGASVVVAKTIAVIAIALSNFFLYRSFVFRPAPESAGAEGDTDGGADRKADGNTDAHGRRAEEQK